MLPVVGLSCLAAFLFALAASLQQHEARRAARSGVRHRVSGVGLARSLPRSRLWLVGWAVNLAGFAAQGAALYFGTIPIVQVVLVTQLIFALPLATLWFRRWPSRRDWLSGAAICSGVILFVLSHGGSAYAGSADRRRVVLALVCAAVAVAVLVAVSVYGTALVEAALLAVAAGICFACSAALIKLTIDDLVERGVAATAVDWPGYALVVTASSGVALGQWAFATGSLPTAVAATTITNPIASYLIGVLAFHVIPATTAPRLAGVVAAGTLLSAGVVGLARSAIVRPSA